VEVEFLPKQWLRLTHIDKVNESTKDGYEPDLNKQGRFVQCSKNCTTDIFLWAIQFKDQPKINLYMVYNRLVTVS